MTTWFRTYYENEDLWLYFEADDEGCAARQAEVRGQDSRPVTAGVLVVLEAAERGATTSFGHLLPDRGCRRRLPGAATRRGPGGPVRRAGCHRAGLDRGAGLIEYLSHSTGA
ncbi:hypothetical protein TNCT1_62160 [Streptomyces sp. 1-11]|nr:hypothetical protein TNCT1_62160 [Streptomyces sp. 1-11]